MISFTKRVHLLLDLLYGECDERMRQEIKYSMLFSVSLMYVSVVIIIIITNF